MVAVTFPLRKSIYIEEKMLVAVIASQSTEANYGKHKASLRTTTINYTVRNLLGCPELSHVIVSYNGEGYNLDEFSENPRLHLVKQKCPMSQFQHINAICTTLETLGAEYILFMDDDDLIDPQIIHDFAKDPPRHPCVWQSKRTALCDGLMFLNPDGPLPPLTMTIEAAREKVNKGAHSPINDFSGTIVSLRVLQEFLNYSEGTVSLDNPICDVYFTAYITGTYPVVRQTGKGYVHHRV